jgi:hypothetical protein
MSSARPRTENTRVPGTRRRGPEAVLHALALAAAVGAVALLAACGGNDGSDSAATAAGIETFGEAANPEDRDAAGTAAEQFLRARANGNSAKACSLMAASTRENLAGFAGQPQEHKPCTALLEALRSQIEAKALTREKRISVAGVRVEGERGFVIYRDSGGERSALAVVREGSTWRVGGIAGYPLP